MQDNYYNIIKLDNNQYYLLEFGGMDRELVKIFNLSLTEGNTGISKEKTNKVIEIIEQTHNSQTFEILNRENEEFWEIINKAKSIVRDIFISRLAKQSFNSSTVLAELNFWKQDYDSLLEYNIRKK